ncbi:DUF6327 family protein [Flavobacterium sangjuense]|uniref:Uncharacterized protein n=1 Tax=Flavobacterium sangjuense TaxID=2518177 RepID=A0A4P7PQI3_9FLAO|nr:DUF6327 family protein [Flavobacterium sangjuense]QBZ97098.1 hypothetical protein GS03_00583 [Flavobacterium sangjuense]
METKKYSSYAEINHDLEILKLEKEIHYKKMLLSIDKTKESFLPSKPVLFVNDLYKKIFSGSLGTILKIAIPYAINWYINRKRGD